MKMRIIICTDNLSVSEALSQHIKAWISSCNNMQKPSISTYQTNDDVLEQWENGEQIDLLFVQEGPLNGITGYEVSHALLQQNYNIPVVLLTNGNSVDLQQYQGDPLRFLQIPFNEQAIHELLRSCWIQIMDSAKDILFLRGRGYVLRIPFRSIRYIEHNNRHTAIHVTYQSEAYTLGCTLMVIACKLPVECFVQCHRSYIVNKSYVTSFQRTNITLLSGDSIPVGRAYRPNTERELSST